LRKLNFGCFDQVVDGWVNTDITPHIFIARIPLAAMLFRKLGLMTATRYEQHRAGLFRKVRYLNLRKRFPFLDSSFDAAFSAHVLEHLYREDAEHCMRELYRILRKNGVLRVSVPDLDEAVRNYDPQHPDVLLDLIYNSAQERDKNRHHWMYNHVSMSQLLLAAGFEKVERRSFREGLCPDLEVIDNRPIGSLFIEAIK
jgi:predicted SAM-dependent methyltransferase